MLLTVDISVFPSGRSRGVVYHRREIQEDRKTGRPAMSVSSSASSSRKTSEARSDVDWEELCQSINTFGLEEEQVRSHLEC